MTLTRVATSTVPTPWGDFTCMAYRRSVDGVEHLAFTCGELASCVAPLVRAHSECLTGDVFGSRRCDCGPQLHQSLTAIRAEGRGVLLYLRGHEGRGIGIGEKIRAYALQETGIDTVDANVMLGHPVDARDYSDASAMLKDLGVSMVRLLTNNPDKTAALRRGGIEVVDRIPVLVAPTNDNAKYLSTKRDRLGHLLSQP